MLEFTPVFEELETSFVAQMEVQPSSYFSPSFDSVVIVRTEPEEE